MLCTVRYHYHYHYHCYKVDSSSCSTSTRSLFPLTCPLIPTPPSSPLTSNMNYQRTSSGCCFRNAQTQSRWCCTHGEPHEAWSWTLIPGLPPACSQAADGREPQDITGGGPARPSYLVGAQTSSGPLDSLTL